MNKRNWAAGSENCENTAMLQVSQASRSGLGPAMRYNRAFRIMASDRVPGVKTTAGAPVTHTVSKEAATAAAKMEAVVRAQRVKRELSKADAITEAKLASAAAPALLEGSHLRTLSAALNSRIDGQASGKDVVVRALRRRMLGLSDADRPLRMLFAGPSGVGKTELGMACCEALLGSCVPDKNFRRWNLSEFSHPSKFNRLTGGDPNYVGYKEGGELTNFIRQAEDRRSMKKGGAGREHTSCVILFDEVDRAADGLLTFLMNFLDSGSIASGNGDTVDATKAVIIMTTNCGRTAINASRDASAAAAAAGSTPLDAFSATDATVAAGAGTRADAGMMAAIKREVLRDICDGRWENLGRLGTIVPFMPLEGEGRRAVVQRQLSAVRGRLRSTRGEGAPTLRISEQLVSHVATQWDDDTGGRSTRDYIEESVVEALAEALDAEGAASAPPPEITLHVEPAAGGAAERVVASVGEPAEEFGSPQVAS